VKPARTNRNINGDTSILVSCLFSFGFAYAE
jgi:hypothetical protein